MCFDRDAPCLFRPLITTDSHDKLRYQFCNSGKKQLFHVKHRFLQCFSLEFYLLFALSLLPHCLMFHLFRYWFNMHAAVCFVDRCLLLLRVFAHDLLCFLLCLLSSRSFTVCSGVPNRLFLMGLAISLMRAMLFNFI